MTTEDENYGEDNNKIMKQIEKGFPETFIAYMKINDRRKAIHYALKNAKKGDIILITGMGAFSSRNDHGKEIPWIDREVVMEYFE